MQVSTRQNFCLIRDKKFSWIKSAMQSDGIDKGESGKRRNKNFRFRIYSLLLIYEQNSFMKCETACLIYGINL